MRRSFPLDFHSHWRVCCLAHICIVERRALTDGIERGPASFSFGCHFCQVWRLVSNPCSFGSSVLLEAFGWCNTGSLNFSEGTCVAAVLVCRLALQYHHALLRCLAPLCPHRCVDCLLSIGGRSYTWVCRRAGGWVLEAGVARAPLRCVDCLSRGRSYTWVCRGQVILVALLVLFVCLCFSRHVLRCTAVFVFGARPTRERAQQF